MVFPQNGTGVLKGLIVVQHHNTHVFRSTRAIASPRRLSSTRYSYVVRHATPPYGCKPGMSIMSISRDLVGLAATLLQRRYLMALMVMLMVMMMVTMMVLMMMMVMMIIMMMMRMMMMVTMMMMVMMVMVNIMMMMTMMMVMMTMTMMVVVMMMMMMVTMVLTSPQS